MAEAELNYQRGIQAAEDGDFRASARPDLPWYWRSVQEGGTIYFAALGVLTTVLTWPYYLYVLWTEGMSRVFKDFFYLWFL